jgi:hypothetical protein
LFIQLNGGGIALSAITPVAALVNAGAKVIAIF